MNDSSTGVDQVPPLHYRVWFLVLTRRIYYIFEFACRIIIITTTLFASVFFFFLLVDEVVELLVRKWAIERGMASEKA